MDRETKIAVNITIFVSLAIGVILGLIENFCFDSKIIEVFALIFLIAGFGCFLRYYVL